MYRTFLNTRYDAQTGTIVNANCSSTPVVRIYHGTTDALIETPTVTLETVEYSTGHYSYPLDWRLYAQDTWYYDIVTFVNNGITGVTQKRFFKWGFAGTLPDGAFGLGYNLNLLACLKVVLENDPTIVSLLGHSASDQRIGRAFAYKKNGMNYPCLTVRPMAQESRKASQNIGNNRRTWIDFSFWDDDNEYLLMQLGDRLITYFDYSNNSGGVKIRTTPNDDGESVFASFTVEYDRHISGEGGALVYWDELQKAYRHGIQYRVDASIVDNS